jgi:hypothetical protein
VGPKKGEVIGAKQIFSSPLSSLRPSYKTTFLEKKNKPKNIKITICFFKIQLPLGFVAVTSILPIEILFGKLAQIQFDLEKYCELFLGARLHE